LLKYESWYPDFKYNNTTEKYLQDIENIFQIQDANKQWIPYKLTNHQREWHFNDVAIQGYLAKHKLVVKSRNTSFTISSIVSVLMSVPFYPEQVIPVVRLNQTRANDLIHEIKKVIKKMHVIKEDDGSYYPFNKDKVDMNATGSIKFPNGVEIRAFPATASASETIRGLRIAGCAGIIDECFTSETLVHTNKGLKSMGELRKIPNLKIKSYNIKSKQIEFKSLNGCMYKKIKTHELIYISTTKDKYSIKCTKEHPFYNNNLKIIKAEKLKKGDIILCDRKQGAKKLSKIQKQIIYGIVLGDGCLRVEKKYKKSANLSTCHCIKQKPYLEHIKNVLDMEEIKENKCVAGVSGYSNNYIYKTRSKNSVEYKQIHDIFYPNGKKTITEENIKLIDKTSLAYWFMDDGSRSDNTHTLNTQAHTYEEQIIIQKYLKNKFNLDCKIKTDKKLYWLNFDRNSGRRLCKIISPRVVECMRYKLWKTTKLFPAYKINKPYKELKIYKHSLKQCKILDIKIIKRRCHVYNLDVADNHNYFVGGNGILVHNCNFMKDFENIYISLRDASAGSVEGRKEFQILIGTTRKGRGTPFNVWYEGIVANKIENIKIYKWPVFNPEVVDLNKSLTEQTLTPIVQWHDVPDLENKRLENINTFKEEYMCMLVDGDSQFYDYASIVKAVNGELEHVTIPKEPGLFYMGIDVASGVNKDYFVISIFEKLLGKQIQRFLYYTKTKQLPEMQEFCIRVIDNWKPYKVRIDSVGVGTQLTQELMRLYPSVVEAIKGNMAIKGFNNINLNLNEFLHTNQNSLFLHNQIELLNDELQIKHYGVWDSNFKAESGVIGHGDIAITNGYALLPDKWKYGKSSQPVHTAHSQHKKPDVTKEEFKSDINSRIKFYQKAKQNKRFI